VAGIDCAAALDVSSVVNATAAAAHNPRRMAGGVQDRGHRAIPGLQRGVTDEAVDVSTLRELRRLQAPGQPDVAVRILTRFFHESDERLATLRAATARGDAPAIERAAHALKGIAGTVGAHEVCNLAQRLEQGGREGRTQDAAGLVNQLDSALERARAIFERALEIPGPAA
jgi:HPt (histidine-containing phosphotransfer) domain-containing protein